MKCPKCRAKNPDESRFCHQCGTPLRPLREHVPSSTQTLFTSIKELPIGSTFADRYQVIEEIGIGGMGRVYKVQDTTIHEKIALKLLNPEIASEEKTVARFRNELKLARQIAHRHVCHMYDLSEAEGMPFITMEYISGEDLKSLIRRVGQISVGKAVHIMEQVGQGLDEAHRLGVIHRDLKPQNIMIDMEGNAKITDFGIARSTKTKGLTDTGVIIGTPEYMSPEQVEGKEIDARTDIYSLGVILYELVTGRLPFEGDTPLSVAIKHKIEEPKPPKDVNAQIPLELNRIILKCMAKGKKQRYQTTGELLEDFRRITESVSTTERVIPERKTRLSKQITVTFDTKKILVPAIIGVAFILLVFVLLQIFSGKKAMPTWSGQPSLAVMYFENNTGDEKLEHWRKGLSDLLISDLSQSKYLRILSGERLFNILEKMNLLRSKTYSSENLKDISERGEVENVLVGRYALAGETWRISIMMQNARTGEILGSESVQGDGEGSIFAMVDELTMKIKTTFKLSSREIAEDIDEEAGMLTTSSPEAFSYYSQGTEFFKRGDYANTIAMMEVAVGLDSEFAMAYRILSLAYMYLGYRSEALERGQMAYDLSEHVSEKERFTIQGQYFFQSEKTFGEAIAVYNRLLALYPLDEAGNNNLGSLYAYLEDWDRAIERFEVNKRLGNDSVHLYRNLSAAYSRSGQYQKAVEALTDSIQNISDNTSAHYNLAQIYLAQGKFDLARDEAEKIFSLDPSHYFNDVVQGDIALYSGDLEEAKNRYLKLLEIQEPSVHYMGLMRSGSLSLLRGQFKEAENHFQEGVELSEMLEDLVQKAAYHASLAYVLYSSGDYDRALEECVFGWESAVSADALEQQRRILHLKGMIVLSQGNLEEARKTAQDLHDLIDVSMKKSSVRYAHHLEGMISTAQGNYAQATKSFQKAISLLPAAFDADDWHSLFHYSLASVYLNAGETEQSLQQYEKIVHLTVGRMHCGNLYAKTLFELGGLHRSMGNVDKAKQDYERFLRIIEDADQTFPEVNDVKKWLKSIGQQQP